jgi:hypothetical protein
MSEQIKLDKVVATYIKIRDEVKARDKAHKESIAELKEQMVKLELYIQKQMDAVGMDSVKAGKHTAFKAMKDSVTIDAKEEFKEFLYGQLLMAFQPWKYKSMEGDWQPDGERDFNEHVETLMKSDALDILTLSANKNSIKAYMDDHKGLTPNGIQYRQEVAIQIRKGK